MSNPESEAKAPNAWQAIFDHMPGLTFLLDSQHKITDANRAVESWRIGLASSVRGLGFHGVMHPKCTHSNCYLLDILKSFHEPPYEKKSWLRFDRTLGRKVHIHIQPLVNSDPRVGSEGEPCISVFVQDCGEIISKFLVEHRQEEQESMTHLVRGLAHEIRNPLAATKTCLQVLIQNFHNFDDAKRKKYLGKVLEGADRLQAILDHTLRRWRFGVDSQEPVIVSTLLERTKNLYEDEMRSREIRFGVSPCSRLRVLGNLTAIEEVISNVITNAMEACGSDDHVGIRCRQEEDEVLIEIRDSGCGIQEEHLGLLFQPYYTTKPKGSGIGLAYAKILMDEMGGGIHICREEKGTTVTLRLPLFEPARDTVKLGSREIG